MGVTGQRELEEELDTLQCDQMYCLIFIYETIPIQYLHAYLDFD